MEKRSLYSFKYYGYGAVLRGVLGVPVWFKSNDWRTFKVIDYFWGEATAVMDDFGDLVRVSP